MSRSVVVHGPQGCGKTRHGQQLAQHFGLDRVIELEDHPPGEEIPPHGALVLTCKGPESIDAPSYTLLSFEQAMQQMATAQALRASAPAILRASANSIDDRAALRDCPGGERSMARCIAAFNALTGHTLSETEGWHFMSILKLARATAGGHHLDDHTDHAAYAALAGEAAEREAQPA